MKKKLTIILIIILGIVALTIPMVIFKMNDKVIIPEVEAKDIVVNITDFSLDTSVNDQIKLSFKLTNQSDGMINNKNLNLNFYQDGMVIYQFEYHIDKLKEGKTRLVSETLNFTYDKISKYEATIENKSIDIAKIER